MEEITIYRDYGKVYKVFLELNATEFTTKDEVDKFVAENFDYKQTHANDAGIEIISVVGRQIELLWEVPINEGVHEIEIDMYYILEDDKYGTYRCEYVR